MNLFGSRPLRMAWELRKESAPSYLVATAHFFPHTFENIFARRLKDNVETVLFEGPLDQESMEKVRYYGQNGTNSASLTDMLDPLTVRRINRKLSNTNPVCSLLGNCLPIFDRPDLDFVQKETRGFRPWMAFFAIWTAYLRTRNWSHSTDMEAYGVAARMGKKVVFLETIEEQLHALDGVPHDAIVRFLGDVDSWDGYTTRFVDLFMKGDLDSMVSSTTGFPTRCPSIVGDRDPVLFERMLPFARTGGAMILVGTIHIPGIRERFIEDGWQITQVSL